MVALEQHAMAQAADLRRLIGKGVSEEAQDLFDALNKTLPCDWNGQTIIVGVVGQNEVIVTPPYTPESASGNDAKSLAHVRKVVRAPPATAISIPLPTVACWCADVGVCLCAPPAADRRADKATEMRVSPK